MLGWSAPPGLRTMLVALAVKTVLQFQLGSIAASVRESCTVQGEGDNGALSPLSLAAGDDFF